MTTKTIQLACGRTMRLKMVSLQKFAATTEIDLPNSARNDISDLIIYGAMITGGSDAKKRAEDNLRVIRSRAQLAKLLGDAPKVWLCTDKGEMPAEGYIADDDLFPVDYDKIQDFFHNGGSDGAPAATDNGLGSGAQTDLPGPAVGEAAE